VNGKRVEGEIAPGQFFAVRRIWKSGDRLEFEISMPLRLQSVDGQNPDTVALLRGPLAMFAVGALPSRFTRAQLLSAAAASRSSDDLIVPSDSGGITFRPFANIHDGTYRLYQIVTG
jgi:DUF1680 family protein